MNQQLLKEFERQVTNLINKNYPTVIGVSEKEFIENIDGLKHKVENIKTVELDFEKGTITFVIVVKSESIGAEKTMPLAEKGGKKGVTILRPHTSNHFKTIDEVSIPNCSIYLLVDIDRGKESINLPPSDARKMINDSGRSPLTIDEGIAIVTHFPDFLKKNNCFSLLASRTGVDKRVPAIWINAKKEPNLGWCWDGNPHTWLGSASCGSRIGI